MAEPESDSIFEFADMMGVTSPLGNWLKPSGNGTAQGASDLHVTQLKGPSRVCTGALYEYRITGFNRTDFILGEMVSKVKWGYTIDGGNIPIPIRPSAEGVVGKHDILMKWQIPIRIEGRHLKMHAWLDDKNIRATTSAEIIAYPFLFHKYKEKGRNEANTAIADDMCYGDGVTRTHHFRYTRAEIEDLGILMQATLLLPARLLWANMRDMVTTLSAGELEKVALAMVARFEENNGAEFIHPILTKKIRAHQSTNQFINRITNGIREMVIESNGDASVLMDETVYHNSRRYGRPVFGGHVTDTVLGGLKICWNDTWSYEVHIMNFYTVNGSYFIKYKISLFDHFGLDIEDLSEDSLVYAQPGFRAWFALQHIHNFRPFIATAIIEDSMVVRP